MERELLTVEEFVTYSGLSSATIRRRLKDGKLPYVQWGGKRHRILIPRAALEVGTSLVPQPAVAPSAAREVEPAPRRRRSGPKPRWQSHIK